MTRTIYGEKWECIKPGCWRSACGRFECVRCQHGLWLGIDIEKTRRDDILAGTLMTAVWQITADARRAGEYRGVQR